LTERCRLTKRIVDAVRPDAKDRVLFDRDLPGFGLKVTPAGRKVFLFQYRFPPGRAGRTRRVTIGEYCEGLTTDQARTIAAQLRGKVAHNRDPFEEQQQAHEDARARQQQEERASARSVAAISGEYLERHVKPRNRSWREYQSLLDRYILPGIGAKCIDELKRADIVGLLDAVEVKRSRHTADAVLRVLRAMLNWYAVRDDSFVNPIVRGMNRGSAKERTRDRVLTDAELRAVWAALLSMPYPFGPLIQMLLLTGQRRDEVASMRWSDIHGDVWIIPKERYKTGRENVTPLTATALRILEATPRIHDLVFTTTGSTPVSGFSRAKRALDHASGTSGWRLHDLRRTARSMMSRAGVSREIAERVLGHAIPGIVAVYDRHDYLAEKRDALLRLEKLIMEVCDDRRGATEAGHEQSGQGKERHRRVKPATSQPRGLHRGATRTLQKADQA
jgi:integrase